MSSTLPESAAALFGALKPRCREIARTWLAELEDIRAVAPRRVFPSDTLLNHIPEILERLMDAALRGERVEDDEFVQRDMEQLADLRRHQGYTVEEVIEEFDLLRRAVFRAIGDEIAAWRTPDVRELVSAFLGLENGLHGLVRLTVGRYQRADREQRLERARLLEHFGRAVTHELRNRVNAASLGLEVLQQLDGSRSDPARREHAARLEASIRRIASVVDDLHAITVAHARPTPVEGRFQDLATLVAHVCEDLEPLARSYGVKIEVPSALPDVPVDAARVQLILVNLVGNGIKFADPQKSSRFVRVRAERRREGGWLVDVEDNGIGIPPERYAAIFESGVRLEATQGGGDGLGLTLAHEAARQLGTSLRVESEPARGSRFSFEVEEPPVGLEPSGRGAEGS